MDKKILIWTSSSKKKMISTKRRLFRDLEIIILIDLTFRDLKQKKENVVYRIQEITTGTNRSQTTWKKTL